MSTARIEAYENTCDYPQCGHVWISREIPARCAKCKGRNWNVAEGKKPKPEASVPQVNPVSRHAGTRKSVKRTTAARNCSACGGLLKNFGNAMVCGNCGRKELK